MYKVHKIYTKKPNIYHVFNIDKMIFLVDNVFYMEENTYISRRNTFFIVKKT